MARSVTRCRTGPPAAPRGSRFSSGRWTTTLKGAFEACQAFVFPTLQDFIGRVAVEALSAGAPVVVSPMTGAVGTIVQDGVNGIVVDPRDASGVGRGDAPCRRPGDSRVLREGVQRLNAPLLPDAAAGSAGRRRPGAGGRAAGANDGRVVHSRPRGAGVQTNRGDAASVLDLRVGEVVEVRSAEEILATLDERGELESLPFMPEMLQFCGRRFRVDKLALKLCDTIDWTGMYRMRNAVHLDGVALRRAGARRLPGRLPHLLEGGVAQAGPGRRPGPEPGPAPLHAGDADGGDAPAAGPRRPRRGAVLLPGDRAAAGRARAHPVVGRPAVRAGRPLGQRRRAGHDPHDRRRPVQRVPGRQPAPAPRPLRIRGGRRYPFIEGRLHKTPQQTLGLQPGELVRVKSREEIVATLDVNNANRGMSFDGEMLRYCGQEARVLRRVEQIIDEKTGKMLRFKNPCIVLDDVTCTGAYHRQCPRGIYPYWREIWLERVE